MTNGRDNNGQFSVGNPGGPGRPRRAVEIDYLSAIGDVVSIDDWREIASRAVVDAKSGDARAREWLAKYLIGEHPLEVLHDYGNVNIYVPDNGRGPTSNDG